MRQVEDILFERGIDISHETVRYWWNRFGPMFAGEIRKRRVHVRNWSNWRWHLDEVFVRINGETHYLWRAIDHEGEVLEVFVTKRRDRQAALKFFKRTIKRYGRPWSIVTDRLRAYSAAMKALGNPGWQERGRWLNSRAENSCGVQIPNQCTIGVEQEFAPHTLSANITETPGPLLLLGAGK